MIWLRWLCVSLALTGWLAAATDLPRDWWLIKDEDPFAALLQELGDEVPDRLRTPNKGASEASIPSPSSSPTPTLGRPAASSKPEAGPFPKPPSFGNSLSSSDRANRPPAQPANRPRAPSGTRLLQTAVVQSTATRQPTTTTLFRPRPQQQTIGATRPVPSVQRTRQPAQSAPPFAQQRPATPRQPPRPSPFDPANSSGARPGGPIVFPTEGPATAQLIPSGESGVECACVPAEACPGPRKETVGSCAPGQVCCPGEYTPKCGRIIPKTRMSKVSITELRRQYHYVPRLAWYWLIALTPKCFSLHT